MKMMAAAYSRSVGEKPWWYTVLQKLGDDSDSDDEDYPSSDNDSHPDDDPNDIDIEDTSDESESVWSEHSSNDDFIDNSDDQN